MVTINNRVLKRRFPKISQLRRRPNADAIIMRVGRLWDTMLNNPPIPYVMTIVVVSQFHFYLPWCIGAWGQHLNSVLNVKALVCAFDQEMGEGPSIYKNVVKKVSDGCHSVLRALSFAFEDWRLKTNKKLFAEVQTFPQTICKICQLEHLTSNLKNNFNQFFTKRSDLTLSIKVK